MSRPKMDSESRSLSASPVFERLIAEGRAGKADGLSADDLDQRRPITAIDRDFTEVFGRVLDRLEAEQGAEVSEEQGRVLKLILTAADLVNGRAPLGRLAQDSGIDETTLQAAAVALESIASRVPTRTG